MGDVYSKSRRLGDGGYRSGVGNWVPLTQLQRGEVGVEVGYGFYAAEIIFQG